MLGRGSRLGRRLRSRLDRLAEGVREATHVLAHPLDLTDLVELLDAAESDGAAVFDDELVLLHAELFARVGALLDEGA